MATYIQLQKIADGIDPNAVDQVQWAFYEASVDVQQEDPQTPNHNVRLSWASLYQRGQIKTPVRTYMSICLENPTLQAGISGTDAAPVVTWADNDVQFVVNSVLNRVAALA